MIQIEAITELDFRILDAIQSIQSDFLTAVMNVFTKAGDAGVFWIALCVVLIIIPRTRRIGIIAGITLLIEYITNDLIIKNLVCRERPFVQHEDVKLLISAPSGYSFPSGHSASSFATSFSVLLQDKRLGAPLLIIAVLIAFSRLYFYVHFPSDVLAGMIWGILVAVIVYLLSRNISTSYYSKNRTKDYTTRA